MNVLRDQDARPEVLAGRRIAVIGYGSQGRAQALNLRDSGLDVVVGLRPRSPRVTDAERDGLRVAEVGAAATAADVVMLLIPDERQPQAYAEQVAPNLRPNAYLGFAHGFAIHFHGLVPAAETDVFMVAPKGIGPMVRQQYVAGGGVAALIAVQQDPAGDTRDVALAYACALGCGRAGIFETTFREETETDLFSEQAVLCGGLTQLIRAGFDTLVGAGYAPEVAYFECLHEVKLIADLIHTRGIAGMRALISNTAKYGDVTRGPRIIGPAVRAEMQRVLGEVQSGEFAREWLAEYAAGAPRLRELVQRDAAAPLEEIGTKLRALMPWLESGESRTRAAEA